LPEAVARGTVSERAKWWWDVWGEMRDVQDAGGEDLETDVEARGAWEQPIFAAMGGDSPRTWKRWSWWQWRRCQNEEEVLEWCKVRAKHLGHGDEWVRDRLREWNEARVPGPRKPSQLWLGAVDGADDPGGSPRPSSKRPTGK
jgi:hypothetical protein